MLSSDVTFSFLSSLTKFAIVDPLTSLWSFDVFVASMSAVNKSNVFH